MLVHQYMLLARMEQYGEQVEAEAAAERLVRGAVERRSRWFRRHSERAVVGREKVTELDKVAGSETAVGRENGSAAATLASCGRHAVEPAR